LGFKKGGFPATGAPTNFFPFSVPIHGMRIHSIFALYGRAEPKTFLPFVVHFYLSLFVPLFVYILNSTAKTGFYIYLF